ncbi:MAG: SufS family cysteine desulfurase [Verrucomicrobiota bacterium]|nr:SufS family cysteine desulfurase [Verrucomicrobiota bacterium]
MREEFPIFQHHPQLVYLDSAATAQKPERVLATLDRFYRFDYGTVHRAIYRQSQRATELYSAAREKARSFLNASSLEEILFTRGTTDGLNLIAQSATAAFVRPGDEILVSEMEHHSNFVPWQMAAERSGAKLCTIPMRTDGTLDWEGKITSKTKIIAVAHMSNVTGTIHPIAQIGREAKRMGAFLVVDGAQAAAHLPVDVQALGADFYAFSGHKCYGPTGIGVLFGRKELLSSMSPIQGGGDMIHEVHLCHTTYAEPPLRFEAGTPAIAPALGLAAALEWIEEKSKDRLLVHTEALTSFAADELLRIPGLKIWGNPPKRGPILTFTLEGLHSLDIASWLDTQEIALRSGHLCAQPTLRKWGITSALRASFAAYNREEDVVQLVKALRQVQGILSHL